MGIFKFFITILSVATLALISFNTLPGKLKKKVDKEVKTTFSTEEFSLEPISISPKVNNTLQKKIKENTFYRISSKEEHIGFAFVDKAPSKTDEFDYLVLFDKNLIIKKTKVLIYREDYGGEIGSKRWLKQFIGKTITDKLKYERDIIAISGATISAHSMTVAINSLLQSIEILQKEKVI